MASLALAWALSVGFIFLCGIDWDFSLRVLGWEEVLVNGSLLSLWAAIPYLILLPIARQGPRPKALLPMLVGGILAFGYAAIRKGLRTPGDEGGSYVVVPLQQMLIAALIVLSWRCIQTWVRRSSR